MNHFIENLTYQLNNNLVVSIVDVIIYAVILYFLFAFLAKHKSKKLIWIVVTVLLVGAVLSNEGLGFTLLPSIFSYTFLLIIAFIILLYPQDIRRSIWKVSSQHDMQETFNTVYNCTEEELNIAISDIVRSAQNMAKKNIGALIIIAPDEVPGHILESGTRLDSVLSSPLIECLFNTKANLHDGAVVIRGNRIMAAGCFLPLTQDAEFDKELGTRHRAGVGITEVCKVLTIIVSEETGVISVAFGGEINRYYDSEMLTDKLEQVYGLKASDTGKKKKKKPKRASRLF